MDVTQAHTEYPTCGASQSHRYSSEQSMDPFSRTRRQFVFNRPTSMPPHLSIWYPLFILAVCSCRFHPERCKQWYSEYWFQASTNLTIPDVSPTALTDPPTLNSRAVRDDGYSQTCSLPLDQSGESSFSLAESLCEVHSSAQTYWNAKAGAEPDRFRLEFDLTWPEGWPPSEDTGSAPVFETIKVPAGATQALLWEGWEVSISWDGPYCEVELE